MDELKQAAKSLSPAKVTKIVTGNKLVQDNQREVIDPNIRTQVLQAQEIVLGGNRRTTWPAGGGAITVKEVDGAPSVADVTTIRVTNGTLTDDGGNQVTISTGGVTDHSALSNLAYAAAGHTGFEPAKGADDNFVTDAEKAALHAKQHAINAAADHTGYGDSVTKNVGTVTGTVAAGDHAHAGVYEPAGVVVADISDITASAAELNLLDTAVADTIVNSKAVIYSAAGRVNATTLAIGGTSITSSAAELNAIDGYTGTAANLNTAVSQMHATGSDTTLGSGCVALDHGTAATDMVVNACYGTGDPPEANTTTEGALYFKYTA